MAEPCNACSAKDAHIAEITKSRDEIKVELEKVQKGHPSLKELLDHAEDGSCSTCKESARQYREKCITKAFEEIGPREAATLAVKRGGVPREFYIAG